MNRPSLPAPGSWRCWLLGIRPKTLFAALNPVLLGSVFAWVDGGFHAVAALAALAGALAIQIGTNLANDYWDWKKGTDTPDRLGPPRVASAGLLPPGAVLRGALGSFAFAALAGIYLVSRGGWPVALIGILSIASGILYTAGPLALAYLGLGNIFTLVFFGPVACAGTYYVQVGRWSAAPVAAGFALGLFTVALLEVNNLRDRVQDAMRNKRTLPVRFGPAFARWEYTLSLMLPLLLPAVAVATGRGRPGLLLVTVVNLPVAVALALRIFRTPEGRELNPLLGATSRAALLYTLTLAAGWVLFHR